MKPGERHSLDLWQQYKKNYLSDSGLDCYRSEAELQKHREWLEAHPIEWCKYFFPKYATADFAPFQIKFINRIINNPEWYEVVSWARELGKDTITMFTILYLVLTGKKHFVVFVSSSFDNACDLLMPYMLNFEYNERLKAYYGTQKNFGNWEEGDFSIRDGAKFIAIGAGQSPRGKKNEAIRPDTIIISDFDTDESVRNPDQVKKNFQWIEEALIPTRSTSKPLLMIVLGNIIARTCCVTLAGKKADHWDIVNIRDKNGRSTWPQKNSEEMIDRVLATISTKAAQQEYFNNPLSEGETFKEIHWGKCPDIRTMKFLVAYADPATSNKDRPKVGGSFKAIFLMGYKEGKYYVYTGFLDQVTNEQFVDWFYAIRDYVNNRCQVYYYIENNTLQDPFYQQVFIPLFTKKGAEKGIIGIVPDKRGKPDKFVRIEGNLEPINRNGQLVFNEEQKNNPNMQRLEEQFLLINPQMKSPADGPDAIEGGKFILDQKRSKLSSDAIVLHKRPANKRRV